MLHGQAPCRIWPLGWRSIGVWQVLHGQAPCKLSKIGPRDFLLCPAVWVDFARAVCSRPYSSCVSSYCTVGFWKPTKEGGAGKCAKVWNEFMEATALFEIQIIGALILLFVIYWYILQLRSITLRSQTLFGLLCACSILLMLVMSSSCHHHVSWLHSLAGWIIYVFNHIQAAYDWFEGDNCFKRVGWCVVQNHVAAGLHVVTIIPQGPKCQIWDNLSENWTNAWNRERFIKIPKSGWALFRLEHVFPGHVQHFAGERCAARLQAESMQNQSRKVEKWKGVFVNFEKSKSRKKYFLIFHFLIDWIFGGCRSSWTCAAKSTKLKPLRVEREEEKPKNRKVEKSKGEREEEKSKSRKVETHTFWLVTFWLFEFLADAVPAEQRQLIV